MLGCGNPDRGDDAAGLEVAERLATRGQPAEVRTWRGEGVGLLDAWEGFERVILVDAMRSGAPPGTVRRVDPLREPMPALGGATSSHAFGPADAIVLAERLGRLPPRLEVFGIEIASVELGAGLSSSVEEGVEEAVRAIADEVATSAGRTGAA